MIARMLSVALPVVVGAFGLQLAHADIFTWVDASGTLNVSNLAPPDGARVTSIIRSPAPSTTAGDDAAREAARQAEVQALADRVRQLEGQVDLASRPMLPPPDYRPVAMPPPIQYVTQVVPPPIQYTVVSTAPETYGAYNGCDPSFIGCGLWWAYPSIVVVRPPNVRPIRPVRGGHNFPVQQPFWGQQPFELPRPVSSAPQPMHASLGVRKG